MIALDRVVVEVAGAFERHGIPYMVIGGVANAVWGVPRVTVDVDLTVGLDADQVERVIVASSQLCDPIPEDPKQFVAETRVMPLRHRESGVRVDVIFALLPYEHEALARARSVELGGVPVRICAVEDLILHKIVSDRPRDREDVAGLLASCRGQLDLDYLEPRVRELAGLLESPDLLERFLAGLEPVDRSGEV